MFPSWFSIRDFIVKYGAWIALACVGIWWFFLREPSVPMATLPSVTEQNVGTAMKQVGKQATQSEVQYITEKIIERTQSEPNIVYITKTEKQADIKAQELAKEEKADFVFKNPVSEYTNNYYAVHTEKNHKIKAGATVVGRQAYLSVGYQDKKNEFILHIRENQVKGATYMRTIKEW